MTDPIADMLTRIRNAHLARKVEVVVPSSRLKLALAEILVAEGYLGRVEQVVDAAATAWSPRTSHRAATRHRGDKLRLILKYDAVGRPALSHLERVSKPSRRVYVAKRDVPTVLSGLGLAVLSTSQGLMTNRQARRAGVGGELICRVY